MKSLLWAVGAFAIGWGFLPMSASQVIQTPQNSHLIFGPPAFAQTETTKAKKKTFVPPKPPTSLRAPGNRTSTGSRGEDAQHQLTEQFVALVPTFEREVDSLTISQVWLPTASTHPTFWFYLPPSEGGVAEFVLEQRQTSSGRRKYALLYRQEVPLKKTGLIAVTLPQSFAGLERGQRYRWSLRLPTPVSPEQQRQLRPIKGWVEFQPLPDPLKAQVQTAPPLQKVQLYGQQGRWLDSFAAMANLYSHDPSQYGEAWRALLAEVGLKQLVEQPMLGAP